MALERSVRAQQLGEFNVKLLNGLGSEGLADVRAQLAGGAGAAGPPEAGTVPSFGGAGTGGRKMSDGMFRAQLTEAGCPVSEAGARALRAAGVQLKDVYTMDAATAQRRAGVSAEDAQLIEALAHALAVHYDAAQAYRATLIDAGCPVSEAGARALYRVGVSLKDMYTMDVAEAQRRAGVSAQDAQLIDALEQERAEKLLELAAAANRCRELAKRMEGFLRGLGPLSHVSRAAVAGHAAAAVANSIETPAQFELLGREQLRKLGFREADIDRIEDHRRRAGRLIPGIDREIPVSDTLVSLADRGDLAGVQRAIAAHIDPNDERQFLSNVGEQGGWSPLCRAANNGHFEVVRALCDAGADVEWAQWDGTTSLMCA
jgi:hypothetical protein